MTNDIDEVQFDEALTLALAVSAATGAPAPASGVRGRLMQAIRSTGAPRTTSEPRTTSVPAGFRFAWAEDNRWLPHPVPGIRMKILALNKPRGYAMLLLDVAPGTRFPAHHHGGAEECYVVSGSLFTCGRQLHAGDFVHAEENSDHGELWTEEGCRVILVVPPEEHLPEELIRSPRLANLDHPDPSQGGRGP